MGKITMTTCDHCRKMVENPFKERGWIQLGIGVEKVSITRSTGVYGRSSYENDYLGAVTDFCSIACLVAALDGRAGVIRAVHEAYGTPNLMGTCWWVEQMSLASDRNGVCVKHHEIRGMDGLCLQCETERSR